MTVVVGVSSIMLKLQGLYKCMAQPHSRKCLSNACFDKLTHNLDCRFCCLVHRGSSFQIQVNCCRMSKWTSLLHICHFHRSSSHNSSTTQANTKLTIKRNEMKKKKIIANTISITMLVFISYVLCLLHSWQTWDLSHG